MTVALGQSRISCCCAFHLGSASYHWVWSGSISSCGCGSSSSSSSWPSLLSPPWHLRGCRSLLLQAPNETKWKILLGERTPNSIFFQASKSVRLSNHLSSKLLIRLGWRGASAFQITNDKYDHPPALGMPWSNRLNVSVNIVESTYIRQTILLLYIRIATTRTIFIEGLYRTPWRANRKESQGISSEGRDEINSIDEFRWLPLLSYMLQSWLPHLKVWLTDSLLLPLLVVVVILSVWDLPIHC